MLNWEFSHNSKVYTKIKSRHVRDFLCWIFRKLIQLCKQPLPITKNCQMSSIGDGKKRRPQTNIVSQHLLQYCFIQFYLHLFAFNHQKRCAVAVINHNIKTHFHFSYADLLFHCSKCRRTTPLLQQPYQHMLPHPLFRSEHHPFFADSTKYLLPSAAYSDERSFFRISQLKHGCKISESLQL